MALVIERYAGTMTESRLEFAWRFVCKAAELFVWRYLKGTCLRLATIMSKEQKRKALDGRCVGTKWGQVGSRKGKHMATRGKGDVHLSVRGVHDMQGCTSCRAASPPPSCGDVVALQSDPPDETDWYERTAMSLGAS